MNKKHVGVDYFERGYNCCQSVLATWSEETGLNESLSLRAGSCLGAGMGYQGKTCGAVVGAQMVIGLLKGTDNLDDISAIQKASMLSKEFNAIFKEKFGSLECRDLLGYDLSTDDGLDAARKSGVFTNLCPGFVAGAIDILESIESDKR